MEEKIGKAHAVGSGEGNGLTVGVDYEEEGWKIFVSVINLCGAHSGGAGKEQLLHLILIITVLHDEFCLHLQGVEFAHALGEFV